jgi:hypothetical protein
LGPAAMATDTNRNTMAKAMMMRFIRTLLMF